MARLLVSVRSATEALLAVRAGTRIIDVKEPGQGSLGRAPFLVWSEVRRAVGATVPVSVALGELTDWLDDPPIVPAGAWRKLRFRKLGLAGAPPDWRHRWQALRDSPSITEGPPWIAVVYADWRSAGAPGPFAVLDAALADRRIEGILVDTWSKSERFRPDLEWVRWAGRVHRAGLALAVAGSIGLSTIREIEEMHPEIVAVRGAACVGGDRRARLDPRRVERLARAAAGLPAIDQPVTSNETPWASGSAEP